MAGDMKLQFGAFSCIAWEEPSIDSSFLKEVTEVRQHKGWNALCPGYTTCFLTIPYLPVEIQKKPSSSSSEESSEENSDSWSYDEGHAPRVGNDYQCSIIPTRQQELEGDDYPNLGELVWDPAKTENEQLQQFLEQTKAPAEHDIDEILEALESEEEPDLPLPLLEPEVKLIRQNLCTQEDAFRLLHTCNYDIEKAVAQMKENHKTWSTKKRHIGAVWSRLDIEKFELGLHNHQKDFRAIVKDELAGSKTYTDIVQYYFIWKKTLRCKIWLKRNKSLYGVPALPPGDSLYTRNKAPVKAENSFRHLASDGRLRNRPRVDYSTTTWIPTKGEPKKKLENGSDEPEEFEMKDDSKVTDRREKPQPKARASKLRAPNNKDPKLVPIKTEASSTPEPSETIGQPEDTAVEEQSLSPENESNIKMEIETESIETKPIETKPIETESAETKPILEHEPEITKLETQTGKASDVGVKLESEQDREKFEAQTVVEKLLQDDAKLNQIVERRLASPHKISITSRLKNSNQKSFYPFRSHMKHHHKKRKVEAVVEPPKTPSEPGTPEIIEEEYEQTWLTSTGSDREQVL